MESRDSARTILMQTRPYLERRAVGFLNAMICGSGKCGGEHCAAGLTRKLVKCEVNRRGELIIGGALRGGENDGLQAILRERGRSRGW